MSVDTLVPIRTFYEMGSSTARTSQNEIQGIRIACCPIRANEIFGVKGIYAIDVATSRRQSILNEILLHQKLCDLNCICRRTFPEIVGDDPHVQSLRL